MNTTHDLTNDTADLILYAAGELPPEQMRAFAARLEADAALREQLQAWQGAMQGNDQTLASLDAAMGERSYDAAARQASHEMKRWVTRRAATPTQPLNVRRPMPWWSVAVGAAAAAVVLSLAGWMLHLPDGTVQSTGPVALNVTPVPESPAVVEPVQYALVLDAWNLTVAEDVLEMDDRIDQMEYDFDVLGAMLSDQGAEEQWF